MTIVVLLALALAGPGCFSLGGSPGEVHEYDLRPVSAETHAAVAPVATPTTLEVEAFSVDEALDREGIFWRRGVETGAYATHRWARPPQEAVRDVLAAALRGALAPVVVAMEPKLADPDLVLRAHLSRCEEVDREDHWLGVVELRVILLRRDGVELLRRTYLEEERAQARNPLGVVEALDRALGRLARDVARDIRRSRGIEDEAAKADR